MVICGDIYQRYKWHICVNWCLVFNACFICMTNLLYFSLKAPSSDLEHWSSVSIFSIHATVCSRFSCSSLLYCSSSLQMMREFVLISHILPVWVQPDANPYIYIYIYRTTKALFHYALFKCILLFYNNSTRLTNCNALHCRIYSSERHDRQ